MTMTNVIQTPQRRLHGNVMKRMRMKTKMRWEVLGAGDGGAASGPTTTGKPRKTRTKSRVKRTGTSDVGAALCSTNFQEATAGNEAQRANFSSQRYIAVLFHHPRWQSPSAWVGYSAPSVCLSVCPHHNSKTDDPKVFKLWIPRNYVDLGLIGQRSRSQGQ